MSTSRELLKKLITITERGRKIPASNDIEEAKGWIYDLWVLLDDLKEYTRIIAFANKIKDVREFSDRIQDATESLEITLRLCEEGGKKTLRDCRIGRGVVAAMEDLDAVSRVLTGEGCVRASLNPVKLANSSTCLRDIVSCLDRFIDYFKDAIKHEKKLIKALDLIKREQAIAEAEEEYGF